MATSIDVSEGRHRSYLLNHILPVFTKDFRVALTSRDSSQRSLKGATAKSS